MCHYMKYLALFSFAMLSISAAAIAPTAEAKEYHSNGIVEFVPNDEITPPVDPENPDPEKPVDPVDPTEPGGEPEPGTAGPLSIDYVSSFDFGKNKISNKDETYYAMAQHYNGHSDSPNYLQVTDNRGTNGGWTLTVAQNGQFMAEKKVQHNNLLGAQITLADPELKSNARSVLKPDAASTIHVDPAGAVSLVLTAKSGIGSGTWDEYWGKVEPFVSKSVLPKQSYNITKAVSLSVPGSTPKDAVTYKTSLTWTLNDIPEN